MLRASVRANGLGLLGTKKFYRKLRSRPRTLIAIAVVLCLGFAHWSLSDLLKRFKSFRFEPEVQLTEDEVNAVAVAHPLPNEVLGMEIRPPLYITKRIHFMYRSYLLYDQLKPFLASWKQVYPDYKIYFWTDREINDLVQRKYAKWSHLYHHQLSNYLERSDTARAFILDAMGGWYADLDSQSLRDASRVAAKHALILPLEPYVHAYDNFNMRRLVSNAIMYSIPKHPFWMYHLERLEASLVGKPRRKSTLEAVHVTGPVKLTEIALTFIQAHYTSCQESRWCPFLAEPVLFLPRYDDHSENMRKQLELYCTYTFLRPEMSAECLRFKKSRYRNNLDTSVSYTYHAFVHLNEKSGAARPKSDVRTWRLNLKVGADILKEL